MLTLTEIEKQAAKPLIYGLRSICAWQQDAKGQTRRLAKPQPEQKWWKPWQSSKGRWWWYDAQGFVGARLIPMRQPHAVGDLLWIREALKRGPNKQVLYRADSVIAGTALIVPIWAWKGDKLPAMFMPRWPCRYYARVVSMRPERLQEISAKDAIAEGSLVGTKYSQAPEVSWGKALDFYADWWDSLHKKAGTRSEDNPWVWVYGLEKADDRSE